MRAQGLFNWGASTDLGVRPVLPMSRCELTRSQKLSLDFHYPPPLSFRLNMASFRNLRFTPLPLGVPPWFLQVMTDASSEGWGIVLPQSQYAGRLYASLLRAHIVLLGLLTFSWALLLGSETLPSLDPYRLSGICTDPTQQLLAHDSAGPIISSNLATSVPQITVATPLLPPRQLQCTGGSIIQRRYHLHRVVHQRHRLQNPAPPCRVRAPDRPICNGPQLPLQDIHLAMSGSSRSGDRRIRPLLGQMAHVVLFPQTPMISRALAKLRQTVFEHAIFVCPLIVGRPW